MGSEPTRITKQQLNQLLKWVGIVNGRINGIEANPILLPQVQPTTPTSPNPQAVNQLRNGSFSHSVKSWDNTAATDNTRYECAWWYSHPDLPNQPLVLNTATTPATRTFVNTDVSVGDDTITVIGHGWATGTAISIAGLGMPNPLVSGTVYYVIKDDDDTIQVAATFDDAIANTPIDLTTAGSGATKTISYDYTLKSDDNTLFSPEFCIWNLTGDFAGTAAMNQGFTLDAPLAGEEAMAQPGYTIYGAINCSRINQYIFAPSTARLGCGLYAEQDSTWDYLTADYNITATVRSPVGTPTSRDYMIHVKTDRGFTVNTNVLTVASAPSDADFANGAGVVLNWQKALNYGVDEYEIYRKTGSTYVLLFRVTNGVTSYIDNNSTLPDTVISFPSADYTGKFSYTATIENTLTNLAIDGISPNWDTIPFALLVPSNYDLGTTDLELKQWIRWDLSGLTNGRFDIRLDDAYPTTVGDEIYSPAAQFTSDMVGLDITVEGNGITYTGTVSTYTDPENIFITPNADPELIAVTVYESGEQANNGSYSYRGVNAGKAYYNLIGEPDNINSWAISNDGTKWYIYNFDDSMYYSSDNPTFPYDVSSWIQDVGALPLPVVAQQAMIATIHGGADRDAVVFDLGQASYGSNAVFSFNAQDFDGTHGIPPCFPNGSNQGGTGTIFPDPGDGAPTCVWTEEDIQVVRGIGTTSVKAKDAEKHDVVIDRDGKLNRIEDIKYHVDTVFRLTTANGFRGHTSATHKYDDKMDSKHGKVLQGFKVGDEIVTCTDGRKEVTTITGIDSIGERSVVQFFLSPGHHFLIGSGSYNNYGGICSHNAKPIQ